MVASSILYNHGYNNSRTRTPIQVHFIIDNALFKRHVLPSQYTLTHHIIQYHRRRNRGAGGALAPPPQYRKILYYFHILTIINHSLQPSAPPTKESFLHL